MSHKHITDKEFHLIRNELNKELVSRMKANASYSMRAFARSLDMPVSTLSAILNGKRRPSRPLFNKLCIQIQMATNLLQKVNEGESYELLQDDELKTITDWFYYPILELLSLKNFEFTIPNIAKSLNLNVATVRDAIERLERLKLIGKDETGKWCDLTLGYTSSISSELTSTARKQQQKELLKKSIEALENVNIEMRSHTSATMAISSKDIHKAKKILDRYRRELSESLSSTSEADQVYTLLLNFFPNTQSH